MLVDLTLSVYFSYRQESACIKMQHSISWLAVVCIQGRPKYSASYQAVALRRPNLTEAIHIQYVEASGGRRGGREGARNRKEATLSDEAICH